MSVQRPHGEGPSGSSSRPPRQEHVTPQESATSNVVQPLLAGSAPVPTSEAEQSLAGRVSPSVSLPASPSIYTSLEESLEYISKCGQTASALVEALEHLDPKLASNSKVVKALIMHFKKSMSPIMSAKPLQRPSLEDLAKLINVLFRWAQKGAPSEDELFSFISILAQHPHTDKALVQSGAFWEVLTSSDITDETKRMSLFQVEDTSLLTALLQALDPPVLEYVLRILTPRGVLSTLAPVLQSRCAPNPTGIFKSARSDAGKILLRSLAEYFKTPEGQRETATGGEGRWSRILHADTRVIGEVVEGFGIPSYPLCCLIFKSLPLEEALSLPGIDALSRDPNLLQALLQDNPQVVLELLKRQEAGGWRISYYSDYGNKLFKFYTSLLHRADAIREQHGQELLQNILKQILRIAEYSLMYEVVWTQSPADPTPFDQVLNILGTRGLAECLPDIWFTPAASRVRDHFPAEVEEMDRQLADRFHALSEDPFLEPNNPIRDYYGYWIQALGHLGPQRTAELLETGHHHREHRFPPVWATAKFLAAFLTQLSNAQFLPPELRTWATYSTALPDDSHALQELSDADLRVFINAFHHLIETSEEAATRLLDLAGARAIPMLPPLAWLHPQVWTQGHALDSSSTRMQLQNMLSLIEGSLHDLLEEDPELLESIAYSPTLGIALIQRDQEQGTDLTWETLTEGNDQILSNPWFVTWLLSQEDWAKYLTHLDTFVFEHHPELQDLLLDKMTWGEGDEPPLAKRLGNKLNLPRLAAQFLAQFGLEKARTSIHPEVFQNPAFWARLAILIPQDRFAEAFRTLVPPRLREDAFFARDLIHCLGGSVLELFGSSVRKNHQIALLAIQSWPNALRWIHSSLLGDPAIRAVVQEHFGELAADIQLAYRNWTKLFEAGQLGLAERPDQLQHMPPAVAVACAATRPPPPESFKREDAFRLFSEFISFLERTATPESIYEMLHLDEYFRDIFFRAYLSDFFPQGLQDVTQPEIDAVLSPLLQDPKAALHNMQTQKPDQWRTVIAKMGESYRHYLNEMKLNIEQNRVFLGAPSSDDERRAFYDQVTTHLREVGSMLQKKPAPAAETQASGSALAAESLSAPPSDEDFSYWRAEWIQGLSAACRCAGGFSELDELADQFAVAEGLVTELSQERALGQVVRTQLRALINRLCVGDDEHTVHVREFLKDRWQVYDGVPFYPGPLTHPPEDADWQAEFDLQMSPANLVEVAHDELSRDERMAQIFDEWVLEHPPEELRAVVEPLIEAQLQALAQQYPAALARFEEDQDAYRRLKESSEAALEEIQTWLKTCPLPQETRDRILKVEQARPGSTCFLIPEGPIRAEYAERLKLAHAIQHAALALNASWSAWGGDLKKSLQDQPTLEHLLVQQRTQRSRQLYMEGAGGVEGLYAKDAPHTSRDQIARVFRDLGIFKQDWEPASDQGEHA